MSEKNLRPESSAAGIKYMHSLICSEIKSAAGNQPPPPQERKLIQTKIRCIESHSGPGRSAIDKDYLLKCSSPRSQPSLKE